MQPHEDWRNRSSLQGIVPAVIVIGIGVLFLLNNLNIFFLHDIWRFWPVILIAFGVVKMVDSPLSSGRITGGVLVVVYALFLANNLGFLHLSWETSWPLVLIGAGVLMLWSRLAPPRAGTANIPAGAGQRGAAEDATFLGGVHNGVDHR